MSSPVDMDLPDRLMEFCRAPHQFLLDLAVAEGPGARFRMNDETFLVLSDPETMFAVLNGKLDDFEKGAMIEIPRQLWHDGIITAEGANWSEQHGMFAPQFARRRVRLLQPVIADLVTKQIEAWAALPAGEPVDMLAAASRLAFDVVATSILGIDDARLADGLFEALSTLDTPETVRLHYLSKRFGRQMKTSFGQSSQSQALEHMHRLALMVADERLGRDAPADDALGEVMATEAFLAFPPERKRMFLANQVTTMLGAGYVTTGESIFWNFYLLAKHPAAQERARAEVLMQTAILDGVVPIDAPPFLAAAFDESQRLYPPVWYLGRVPLRDICVRGMDIAAGTRVICSPYVLQRMPELWPESDQYRPERFLPDAPAPVTPRSFIPFSVGRRACIGRGLALMEMAAISCATLARFDLELVRDVPIALTGALSLHPHERIFFRLKPRA